MSDKQNSDTTAMQFGISNVHFCPDCKKPLRRVSGKMGPFWSCTGFPDCRTTRDDVDGKPSTEPDAHYCCPVCTRRMVRVDDSSGNRMWLCTGASRGCKVRLNDDCGRPEQAYRCGDCGQLLKLRHGKHGKFWGCSQYPDCTQTYNDNDGKPDLEEDRKP